MKKNDIDLYGKVAGWHSNNLLLLYIFGKLYYDLRVI